MDYRDQINNVEFMKRMFRLIETEAILACRKEEDDKSRYEALNVIAIIAHLFCCNNNHLEDLKDAITAENYYILHKTFEAIKKANKKVEKGDDDGTI